MNKIENNFKNIFGVDQQASTLQKSVDVIASEKIIKSDQQNPFIVNKKVNPIEVYNEIVASIFDIKVPLTKAEKEKAQVYYATALALMDEKMLPATAKNIRIHIVEIKKVAEEYLNPKPTPEEQTMDEIKKDLKRIVDKEPSTQNMPQRSTTIPSKSGVNKSKDCGCSKKYYEKKYFGMYYKYWVCLGIALGIALLFKKSNSN